MAAWSGWEHDILGALGAPATPDNLRLIEAWQRAEGGSATFNPLNTTQSAPGSSNYNSVGVKNYPSAAVGTKATVQTLTNGRYNGIVRDLRAGNVAPALLASRNASEFGTWGTGAGNILGVLGMHLPPSAAPSRGGTAATKTPRARPGGSPGGVGADVAAVFDSGASTLGTLTGGLFSTLSGPLEFYKFIMAILSPRMWLRAFEAGVGLVLLVLGIVLVAADAGGEVAAAVPAPAKKLTKRTLTGVAVGAAAERKVEKKAAKKARKKARLPRAELTKRERTLETRKGMRAAQAAVLRQEGRKMEASKQFKQRAAKHEQDQRDLRKFRRQSAMGKKAA